MQSPSTSTQLIRRAATQIYRKRSVRRTSTMPLSTVNRYKKRPIGPGDLNIPSFEIPFIDSDSASPLDGNGKDPLPLKSGIFCHFSTIMYISFKICTYPDTAEIKDLVMNCKINSTKPERLGAC